MITTVIRQTETKKDTGGIVIVLYGGDWLYVQTHYQPSKAADTHTQPFPDDLERHCCMNAKKPLLPWISQQVEVTPDVRAVRHSGQHCQQLSAIYVVSYSF